MPDSLSFSEDIVRAVARELAIGVGQVRAVVELLESGATIPFIARYRKEKTGGLDDVQLRSLQERLTYLRDLAARREAILLSLKERDLLSAALEQALQAAGTKSELEAIYAPYKVKRRTLAQIAREAGLEPLVDDLLEVPLAPLHDIAAAYIHDAEDGAPADTAVPDAQAALAGARAILIERALYRVELVDELREKLWRNGVISSRAAAGVATDSKFSDYFDFAEAIRRIPSHRLLALSRAEAEGAVKVSVDVALAPVGISKLRGAERAQAEAQAEDYEAERRTYEHQVALALGIPVQVLNTVADEEMVLGWLAATVRTAWRSRLLPRLAGEIRTSLKERAEADAIEVFASNLRDVLLAAPAGTRTTLGLDPGIRTGVKLAVVDATGQVLETGVIHPFAPRFDRAGSLEKLRFLVEKYEVELISIGNGTASRDTDRLVGELLASLKGAKPQKVVVSEAGASVYSASALASEELPDMDVSLRGAVSIARRLQDPLAELVKIDPQSIGVGQYQHDVSASALSRALDAVVEDCVNAVGVWVNSASPALLSRVAGLSLSISENIVAYRDSHGAFSRREDLLKVPRLGPKAFEQAAGFVRIAGGTEPLDASGVHPEAYEVARAIVADAGGLQGSSVDAAQLAKLTPESYVTADFGLPTVRDIFAELERPGRDPRPEFRTARFAEGVESLDDVKPGMILEGTVSNVAAFGAFVDVGVHQDGLVHVSQMSESFVSDPHEIVKSGDIVQVRVIEVDAARKRMSLSLLLEKPSASRARRRR